MTIFGKIHKSPEDLPELCPGVSERWLEVLRAGAAAARFVAVELDQAAELLAKVGSAKAAPSAEREQAYHDLLKAFGKLNPAGRRAIVSYLKTQATGDE